jgi:hypothetical protein
MKKIIILLVIFSFTFFNSCDQSNSQLFDLILEIKSQNDQLLNEVKTLQIKSGYGVTGAFGAINSF